MIFVIEYGGWFKEKDARFVCKKWKQATGLFLKGLKMRNVRAVRFFVSTKNSCWLLTDCYKDGTCLARGLCDLPTKDIIKAFEKLIKRARR